MSTEFTVQTSIAIAPWTSQGIFYQGDPVTISNSLGTTIEVYDFHGNSITTAPPPVTLTTLPMGHYFVQVDGINGGFGDRAQFSIWPKGYTNYLHSDIGLEPTNLWCTTYEIARFLRMVPGFSREQTRWEDVYSNGVYNWTSYWDVLAQGKTAPIKVMNLITYHSGSVTSNLSAPLEETTNSMSNWVNDVAVLWSNAAARYGTNFVYEILNEPSWVSITFPTNQYIVPPAPNSLEVYPSRNGGQRRCTSNKVCLSELPNLGSGDIRGRRWVLHARCDGCFRAAILHKCYDVVSAWPFLSLRTGRR